METFAERLKYIMGKRNMTAAELAKKTNTPEAVISQYRSGKYKPKQNRLFDFAQVLDVSIPWLMGLDVPMTSEQPETEEAQLSETKAALIEVIKGITDEQAAAILQLLKRQ